MEQEHLVQSLPFFRSGLNDRQCSRSKKCPFWALFCFCHGSSIHPFPKNEVSMKLRTDSFSNASRSMPCFYPLLAWRIKDLLEKERARGIHSFPYDEGNDRNLKFSRAGMNGSMIRTETKAQSERKWEFERFLISKINSIRYLPLQVKVARIAFLCSEHNFDVQKDNKDISNIVLGITSFASQ